MCDSRLKRALTTDSLTPDKHPPQKRSRVSRACDQCRATREKCDGAQPVCQTCTSQERTCSYDEQPKKRGIQPNYIRTLELTLSWLFRTMPESERMLASRLAAPDAATRQLISGKDGQSDALHQGWRNSTVCKQIDQLLSGGTVDRPKTLRAEETYQSPPLSVPSERTLAQNDTRAATEPAAYNSNTITNAHVQGQYQAQAQPHLRGQVQQQPRPGLAPEPYLDVAAGKRILLPPRAWTLVEYYFAFTHAWLPMTDRQATLKIMYTYPSDGVLGSSAMNGEYAELWSILALAGAQIADQGLNSESEQYRDIARSLIPSERSAYELGHVRAMIILAVLEINRQQWMAAWMHVGLAVRVIVVWASARIAFKLESEPGIKQWTGDVSLYPALSAIGFKAAQSERFNHTALSAFILESAIASRIGVPPHLQPNQINALGMLDEDGLEEWSPWHDPMSTCLTNDTKAPARSFSTLNRLVRMGLCSESIEWDVAAQTNSTMLSNVVLRLVHNAGQAVSRLQPAILVSTFGAVPNDHLAENPGLRSLHNSVTDLASTQWEDTGSLEQHLSPQDVRHPIQQQLPYMSIPETMDLGYSNSPSVPGNTNMTPDFWVGHGMQNPLDQQLDMDNGSTIASADLFEELAMLERTHSGQNPQFMQNLGFAADLDLADFLGADFQGL